MSRVDDDRDAARVAARLQEAKRQEEAQRGKKAAENAAFSKLMQGAKKEQVAAQQQGLAKSAIAQLLEAAEAEHAGEAGHLEHAASESHQNESAFRSRVSVAGQETRHSQVERHENQAGTDAKLASDQGNAEAGASRQADQSSAARGAQGRSGDARVNRERAEGRKEGADSKGASAAGAGGARAEKGDLKADADKGGGQQQGGNKDDKGSGAANPGFRFNPALMAPVPVAKAKEASGSERLRKVANELAQKIVERVRVGTNAMGKMEFQIDLRSDVLSGLSVKVSAKNGKISAVFQGSDKDVLKMLEEQRETLKAALGTRGLTLEDLKIEARG